MNAASLRESLHHVRDKLSDDQAIRIHRAISWLRCAENYGPSDDDIAFISLWISFNACYAIDDQSTEHNTRKDFNAFTQKLCGLDTDRKIHNLLWMKYSQFVRLIIENQYVFAPFWTYARTGVEDWKEQFDASKKRAFRALANDDTPLLLSIILDRLYVLRNQLLHGGATYQSKLNRSQVKDGKRLLFELMPICIELMLVEEEWGEIYYPVVE